MENFCFITCDDICEQDWSTVSRSVMSEQMFFGFSEPFSTLFGLVKFIMKNSS